MSVRLYLEQTLVHVEQKTDHMLDVWTKRKITQNNYSLLISKIENIC